MEKVELYYKVVIVIEEVNKFYKQLQEHHIVFWFIIFFPVAIYRLIKYKIVPKFVSILMLLIMSIILILIIIGSIDMIKNPMRVADNKLLKEVKEYNLGDTRELQYLGAMSDDFGIYEWITTKGYYHIYISIENKNDIKIEGIKELLSNKTVKWSKSLPKEYKNIPAPILRLFIDERNYGKDIESINMSDYNQYLITYKDNSIYEFDIQYYKVYQIYDVTNDNQELLYTCKTLITFFDDFQKVIDNNMKIYKNVKTINALEITETKIEYTFENFCGNSYKIVKNNDGSYNIKESANNISNKKMEEKWKTYQKKGN